MKFKIIMAAYGCEKWIERCIDSIFEQTYTNWDLTVAEDCSKDDTAKVLKRVHNKYDRRFRTDYATSNCGVLARQHHAIALAKPEDEDVILIMDSDDWLTDKNSLQIVADAYADHNVWMTYGSLVRHPRGSRGRNAIPVKKGYDFRRKPWVLTHMRTFKYFLFKNIFDEDLRFTQTGEYYRAAADTATMKPMAEMAGWDHIRYIDKLIYTYNQTNKGKVGTRLRRIQAQGGSEVRHRLRYKQRTKQELLQGFKER